MMTSLRDEQIDRHGKLWNYPQRRRLTEGAQTPVPRWERWDTLVHVYRGSADVNGTPLALAEGALLIDEAAVTVTATSDATLLVFLINRNAPLTHAGTIGG